MASPVHDRLPDTPIGTLSTVFTIDYSTGWHGFLPSICKNFDWSQHGLEDNDGTLFRFKDSQGSLDATPEPSAFPIRVVPLTPEQRGLPEGCPEPDTLVDEGAIATSGTPAPQSHADRKGGEPTESKPGEGEESRLGEATGSKPGEGGEPTGLKLGERMEPTGSKPGEGGESSGSKPEQTNVEATQKETQDSDDDQSERPTMYEDGTYWKNLVCKQFHMVMSSRSS